MDDRAVLVGARLGALDGDAGIEPGRLAEGAESSPRSTIRRRRSS